MKEMNRILRNKCECGGNVKYVIDFGQKWSWCDACTPVVSLSPTPFKPSGRIPPSTERF